MWRVSLAETRGVEEFEPPQAAHASADEVVRLAETLAESDDQPAPAVEALRAFVARSRGETFDARLAEPESRLVPAIDPIMRWAKQAVDGVASASERVSLRELDGSLGLIENGELSSLAWHGNTTAVVPITQPTQAVELRYAPGADERQRRDFFLSSYARALGVPSWWPWPEVEMSADVLGFFSDAVGGPSLAAIEARSARSPRRYVFQLELPAKVAGFLVVKPLYRLARNLRVRARDPLWRARVRRAEKGQNGLPPRLEDSEPSAGRLVVLVHGVASTAAEMARTLGPLALSASRFEHDTFISIDRNASDLSRLLEERAEGSDKIVFLCHSRGGLVARAGADLLPDEMAARTEIHTFGTPHTGTPLADFAPIVPAIRMLDFVRHPGDAVRAADMYLHSLALRTPEGIAQMSPDHEFIDRMSRGAHKPLGLLNSWGAVYEDGCAGAWWYRPFARACAGILPTPNDLVVPESSCLGAGSPQGPLEAPSTHFDYLGLEQIHEYLRGALS
jgi:pimeloyl-ACP methyl ester carboxylesterase